jgi:hypothetical protein
VFAKLQLKDQHSIVVLDAPTSFEPALRSLKDIEVRRAPGTARLGFALAFVTRQSVLNRYAEQLAAAAEGDAALWFAYPKGSSKRYTCDFNRDSGWQVLGDRGFEPVRMIAIDEDWSALRFRRAEYIATMKRGAAHAMSRLGKQRARKRGT